MAQATIISLNNAPAIILAPTALDGTGLNIGDTVEVTVSGREVGVTLPKEASRDEQIELLSDEILERRHDAYKRLA